MLMTKLTTNFRLQAYTSATIINNMNQLFSALEPFGDRKNGSLHHEDKSKSISTRQILIIAKNIMKKIHELLLIFISLHGASSSISWSYLKCIYIYMCVLNYLISQD